MVKDYDMKVGYLTQHFGRMWTRFNYFVGIESALIGGKLIFGDGKLSRAVAIVGVVVSLIWYVMGAEDRFLVRVYREHVKDAGDLLAKSLWGPTETPYRHVGEVTESGKALRGELSGWRWEPISTTRLAALIPLLLLLAWLVLFLMLARG
ncbi:MAG: hypothetical protein ABJD07_09865 [Gemmatimonadaceae bacterium]